MNEFYKTIKEWLTPLGYIECYKSTNTQKIEFHFIFEQIRVVCVKHLTQEYCYLHADVFTPPEGHGFGLQSTKMRVKDIHLSKVHSEMKKNILKLKAPDGPTKFTPPTATTLFDPNEVDILHVTSVKVIGGLLPGNYLGNWKGFIISIKQNGEFKDVKVTHNLGDFDHDCAVSVSHSGQLTVLKSYKFTNITFEYEK